MDEMTYYHNPITWKNIQYICQELYQLRIITPSKEGGGTRASSSSSSSRRNNHHRMLQSSLESLPTRNHDNDDNEEEEGERDEEEEDEYEDEEYEEEYHHKQQQQQQKKQKKPHQTHHQSHQQKTTSAVTRSNRRANSNSNRDEEDDVEDDLDDEEEGQRQGLQQQEEEEEDEYHICNIIDIIMDTFSFVSIHIPMLLHYSLSQHTTPNTTPTNTITNTNANATVSPAILQQIFHSNGLIIIIFVSSSYLTGILRDYTNIHEANRKCFLYHHGLDIIMKQCLLYEQNTLLISYYNYVMMKLMSGQGQSDGYESLLIQKTNIDKLMTSFIQCIGILRNLTLDKLGRQMIGEKKYISKLCSCLSIYRAYPEIILTIARVMAKLSLYDIFRNQISLKTVYIEYFMNIIEWEADKCHQIMNITPTNSTNSGENKKIEWPVWYTWPMISRISFTLGNLTTSNEHNRYVI